MPDTRTRSWTLPLATWQSWWQSAPRDALVLASRYDEVALCRHRTASEADWDRGHLFTEDWSVQWRRLGSQVRIVVVGDVPETDGWGEAHATLDLSAAEPATQRVILWGYRLAEEDHWIELRVPKIMDAPKHHPAEHGEDFSAHHLRRALQVKLYMMDGEVIFHRFSGLEYGQTNAQGYGFDLLTT